MTGASAEPALSAPSVEEGPLTGGWAGEVGALMAEQGLHEIDDIWRLITPDHPIPYRPPLEDAFLPGPDAIAASVAGRLGSTGGAGAEHRYSPAS